MSVEYVGPEHFDDAEPGRDPSPDWQVATNLVHWIESGFPEEVTVVGTSKRMRATDLVQSAFKWHLAVPLPMPDDLATAVREHVPDDPFLASQEDGETITWSDAVWCLKEDA